MRTLNIDTLKIEGTPDTKDQLVLTSGDNNDIIECLKDLSLENKNIRTLFICLESPRGKLIAEAKRLIMMIHLTKNGDINTADIHWSDTFLRQGYAKAYDHGLCLQILLGTKKNRLELKKVTISSALCHDSEIDSYLDIQVKHLKTVRERIDVVNQYIENVFNQF